MNIFEGSRRVALLVAGLIVIGFAVAFFTARSKPVKVSYLIDRTLKTPIRVDECGATITQTTKEDITLSGREVQIRFCFKEPTIMEPPRAKEEVRGRFWVKTPDGTSVMVVATKKAPEDWIKFLGKTWWLTSIAGFVDADDKTKWSIYNKYAIDQFFIHPPGTHDQSAISTAKPVDSEVPWSHRKSIEKIT